MLESGTAEGGPGPPSHSEPRPQRATAGLWSVVQGDPRRDAASVHLGRGPCSGYFLPLLAQTQLSEGSRLGGLVPPHALLSGGKRGVRDGCTGRQT